MEFDKFIKASKTGRRRKPCGNRFAPGTIKAYVNCRRLLQEFSDCSKMQLEIFTSLRNSKLEFRQRKLYWERFSRQFGDHLYASGYFDNYVANVFKIIRTLLHFLNESYGWQEHQYLLYRYTRQEKIPVIALSLEQFRYLLRDERYRNSLTPNQAIILDIFLFGCFTTLRFGDLNRIRRKNLVCVGKYTHLVMHSEKTGIKTELLLPDAAMSILAKYRLTGERLLPRISNVNLNIQIKKVAEKAGWTYDLPKFRNKRNVPRQFLKHGNNQVPRFCDQLTTHTMRKTGISLLLMMGMPEQLVRKISGHKPGSREFYRYTCLSQQWQDEHSINAFSKI